MVCVSKLITLVSSVMQLLQERILLKMLKRNLREYRRLWESSLSTCFEACFDQSFRWDVLMRLRDILYNSKTVG